MTTDAEEKFVLITGCTPGGIGHALALEFQSKGFHVIATARNAAALEALADNGMTPIQLEVTSPESIAACKAQVQALTSGRLDILVNNAGRSHTVPALDIDLDDVRATYETNVFAPMLISQAFVPFLIPTKGLIINISSISAQVPYLFRSVYSSTKAALDVYSRVLRLELSPFGVRVMVVRAGTVRSNFASHVERELAPASLYKPIEDIFRRYLTFSQENATMPTDVFARGVVSAALKGDGCFGGLVGGTPASFWSGGLWRLVWTSTWLPNWFVERAAGVFFGMGKIRRQLAMATKRD